MRPLWEFLIKNYFVFLFILLESLAITMFINYSYHQRAIIVGATNEITGNIYRLRSGIAQYFSLRKINKDLAEQNARLLNEQRKAFLVSDTGRFFVNDSVYRQQYSYIVARVINNTTQRTANYLTLDKGADDGITKDMAVIYPNGIVGIVTEVSRNFSSVMSLLHPKARISAKLKKNNYVGTVVWEGGRINIASLLDIPTHVKIEKGDTVVTSGYSLLFPEGIIIGTIDTFNVKHGKDFYHINIKLTTDFHNISYVYVVRNLFKNELQQLESEAQTE